MVVQGHKSLIVLLTVVEEHIFVPASASQQISLLTLCVCLISWWAFRRWNTALWHRTRVSEADYLAIMRFHEELLGQYRIVQLVNPNITDLVTAGEMITIWADSNAPDRVDHVEQVYAALLCSHNRLSVFAPIERTSLEVIIHANLRFRLVDLGLSGLSQRALNEYHLTHIFAVCIFSQTLVDFLLLLRRYCGVDKVPESNRSVR